MSAEAAALCALVVYPQDVRLNHLSYGRSPYDLRTCLIRMSYASLCKPPCRLSYTGLPDRPIQTPLLPVRALSVLQTHLIAVSPYFFSMMYTCSSLPMSFILNVFERSSLQSSVMHGSPSLSTDHPAIYVQCAEPVLKLWLDPAAELA